MHLSGALPDLANRKKINVLSWALASTSSVLFIRLVALKPPCQFAAHVHACALPLFVAYP